MEINRSTAGQGLVEYSLILLLVALVVILGLTYFGVELGNTFSNIVDQVIAVQ